MKKIALLLVTACIAFSCNETKQETPKNAEILQDNLQGKVQQTTETSYQADSTGQIGEQDSCCVVQLSYDEKGYITDYSSNNKSGTEKTKEVYEHYDNGAMKSIMTTKNDKRTSKISIDIDDDGKYTTAKSFDSTDKMDSYYTDIVSNEYGGLTSFKQYKPDSTLKISMTSTYDGQFFVANSSKDSSGKETFSSSLKRDDKNNVVEKATKDVTRDSTTNKLIKYRYDSFDENGNWTQRTEMDESGTPVKITKRTITYYKE